jgi:hypothetical protein
MNWEIGAAIAEIASAIGVIITLAYLAYQISQTNRIAKSAVVREIEQEYIDLYATISTDAEFANLVTKLRDSSYSAESEVEDEKLENFALRLASIWLSVQVCYDQSQMDPKTFPLYKEDVKAKLAHWPAIRPYVKKIMERYPSIKGGDIYKEVFK